MSLNLQSCIHRLAQSLYLASMFLCKLTNLSLCKYTFQVAIVSSWMRPNMLLENRWLLNMILIFALCKYIWIIFSLYQKKWVLLFLICMMLFFEIENGNKYFQIYIFISESKTAGLWGRTRVAAVIFVIRFYRPQLVKTSAWV